MLAIAPLLMLDFARGPIGGQHFILVLTDAGASTILAPTALSLARTETRPSTLLASTAYSPVVTDAPASTLSALAALSPVLTDAHASTLFAFIASSHTGGMVNIKRPAP